MTTNAPARVKVTCEYCLHKQYTERVVTGPVRFHCVCHHCEAVLLVQVEPDSFANTVTETVRGR